MVDNIWDKLSNDKNDLFHNLSYPEMEKLSALIFKECYAQEIISMDEYQKKASALSRAKNTSDLKILLEDLPVDLSSLPRFREGNKSQLHSNRSRNITIFLGDRKLHGEKLTYPHSDAFVVLGSLILDYTRTLLPPEITRVNLTGLLSSTKIIVPPDLPVITDITPIMGSVKEHRDLRVHQTERGPLLKISGIIFLSDVNIKVKEL